MSKNVTGTNIPSVYFVQNLDRRPKYQILPILLFHDRNQTKNGRTGLFCAAFVMQRMPSTWPGYHGVLFQTFLLCHDREQGKLRTK